MAIKMCEKCHSQLDHDGQHYHMAQCVKDRIAELETALVQACNAARLYGYRESAPMIDAMRVRRSIT